MKRLIGIKNLKEESVMSVKGSLNLRKLLSGDAIRKIVKGEDVTFVPLLDDSKESLNALSDKIQYLQCWYTKEQDTEEVSLEAILNSRGIIKDFLNKDAKLTDAIKKDFISEDIPHKKIVVSQWLKVWLDKNGYNAGDLVRGNSITWGKPPVKVTPFIFAHFIDRDNNKEGLAVMWYKDLKTGKLTNPEIWTGETGKVKEFVSAITSDLSEKVSQLLGFSNWEEMKNELLYIVHDWEKTYKEYGEDVLPPKKEQKKQEYYYEEEEEQEEPADPYLKSPRRFKRFFP